MPKHTPAKRAQNRRRALTKLRKSLGAQFTEKEGAALKKLEAGLGKSKAANAALLKRGRAVAKRTRQRKR